MYPVIDCSEFDYDLIEQVGSKEKFWLIDDDGQRKLFKKTRLGENWSEKIAYELCRHFEIPCAHYDLATYAGSKGVLSTSVVPEGEALVLGNELMVRSATEEELRFKVNLKRHSTNLVSLIMSRIIVNKPSKFRSLPNVKNAFDFFIGYIALDTLISNQDRHYQNWGYIQGDGHVYLAPTFDHAASLGRNESDEIRKERLVTKDSGRQVKNYVKRSKSFFYDHNGKRLKNAEAFSAFARQSPSAATEWVDRMKGLSDNSIIGMLDMIPDTEISAVGKEFAMVMMKCNLELLGQEMVHLK